MHWSLIGFDRDRYSMSILYVDFLSMHRDRTEVETVIFSQRSNEDKPLDSLLSLLSKKECGKTPDRVTPLTCEYLHFWHLMLSGCGRPGSSLFSSSRMRGSTCSFASSRCLIPKGTLVWTTMEVPHSGDSAQKESTVQNHTTMDGLTLLTLNSTTQV